MIDDNFKVNWKKILKYNSDVNLIKEPDKKELVKVPFTPIEIDAKILYYLFELLYPKFINDQHNILDIFITDDFSEILSIYLYETKKAGIHESIIKLNADSFDLNGVEFDNIGKFFNNIQLAVTKTSGIRISSIRVFKKSAIDRLNNYSLNIEKSNHYSFILHLMNLIQALFEQQLFYIYPTPNCYLFIHNLISLFKGINISSMVRFVYDLLPYFNISLLLNSKEQPIILKLQNMEYNDNTTDVPLLITDLIDPKDLGILIDKNNIQNTLIAIQEQLKTEKAYVFNQNDIISLINNLIELERPIPISKIKILMQKALYGFRNFDTHWKMVPRPLVYNNIVRFFLRSFGININLKKLSHWAIPETFFDFVVSNFGLNAKILVIVTSIKNPKYIKDQFLQTSFSSAILFQVENKQIITISTIDKDDLFLEDQINTLDVIRNNVSRKHGYISAVLNVDSNFLREIFKNFYSNTSKFNPLLKFKSFKMIKQNYNFNIFPEVPLIRLIKKKGFKFFIRNILTILIDKHEF